MDCCKDLSGFTAEPPLLLLMLADHDPDTSRMREVLPMLPESPHAELRIVISSLMGHGLYEPGVLTVDDTLIRLGDRI